MVPAIHFGTVSIMPILNCSTKPYPMLNVTYIDGIVAIMLLPALMSHLRKIRSAEHNNWKQTVSILIACHVLYTLQTHVNVWGIFVHTRWLVWNRFNFQFFHFWEKSYHFTSVAANKKGIEYTCLKLGGPPEPVFPHLGCNWFICSVGPGGYQTHTDWNSWLIIYGFPGWLVFVASLGFDFSRYWHEIWWFSWRLIPVGVSGLRIREWSEFGHLEGDRSHNPTLPTWHPKRGLVCFLLTYCCRFRTPARKPPGMYKNPLKEWDSHHPVDGRNPAPADMLHIPLFTRFYTSQVVRRILGPINSIDWRSKSIPSPQEGVRP